MYIYIYRALLRAGGGGSPPPKKFIFYLVWPVGGVWLPNFGDLLPMHPSGAYCTHIVETVRSFGEKRLERSSSNQIAA